MARQTDAAGNVGADSAGFDIDVSGFIFASLLGGAVVTEMLFARQGIGRMMLDAAVAKDAPVVLGITLLAALVYVVVNLLVDVLNGLIDPRVKPR